MIGAFAKKMLCADPAVFRDAPLPVYAAGTQKRAMPSDDTASVCAVLEVEGERGDAARGGNITQAARTRFGGDLSGVPCQGPEWGWHWTACDNLAIISGDGGARGHVTVHLQTTRSPANRGPQQITSQGVNANADQTPIRTQGHAGRRRQRGRAESTRGPRASRADQDRPADRQDRPARRRAASRWSRASSPS